MAKIITPNTIPQIATFRYNVMKKAERNCNKKIKFEIINDNLYKSKLEILQIENKETIKDISDAKVLVVAGNGVRSKEDLSLIYKLSESLGGEIAGTKAVVQKGWISEDRQIGLSGKCVSPHLMITCGVSGSVQFLAGIKNVHKLISINNDYDAKIFTICHIPILGDLYDIIPLLIKNIEEYKDSCRNI